MKTALILSAGRGERLRPLTNRLPKALCPVQGMPLIERHVRELAKAGFEHIVINHAYLGDQIKRHLGHGARFHVDITYTPEPPGGLETAGGIFNALPYLNETPFVTVNADILTDFPFATLRRPMTHPVHLILVPRQESHQGDFGLSHDTHLVLNSPRLYVFPGIACYDPSLFRAQQPGRYSVTPLLRQWTEQQRITGELYEGLWFDIGTPERLQRANEAFQTKVIMSK